MNLENTANCKFELITKISSHILLTKANKT